jgi:hypothetical protein
MVAASTPTVVASCLMAGVVASASTWVIERYGGLVGGVIATSPAILLAFTAINAVDRDGTACSVIQAKLNCKRQFQFLSQCLNL